MIATKLLIGKGKRLTPQMRGEIAVLPGLTVNELREKFGEVLGYATGSRNRQFLIRKLTWAIQVREWGDISPQTRARAHELADFRFLRVRMSNSIAIPTDDTGRTVVRKPARLSRNPRLPIPGSVITKDYDGKRIEVRVLENGFEYNNQRYRSLSAIAHEITGTSWNGFIFFLGTGGSK